MAQIPQPAQPRDFSKRRVIDEVKLQVSYKNLSRQVLHMESFASDLQILEIGNVCSRYYSRYAELEDSLYTYKRQFGLGSDKEGHRRQGTYEDFYFDYPKKGTMSVFTRYLKNTYMYTESNPKPMWTLLPETMTILGYTCQKASTQYHGRVWYAWFTIEIPIQSGPWKLKGLPGLILRAEDSDRYFIFEATEISRAQGKSIMKYDIPVGKCKREDIIMLNDLRWQDDDLLMRIVSGDELLVVDPKTAKIVDKERTIRSVIPQKELK